MPDALRDQLLKLLDFKEAHADFDTAVKDVPVAVRGKVPAGAAHSLWQILEHLRIAQNDIWDFSVNPGYVDKEWPGDYWPANPEPPTPAAWAPIGPVGDQMSSQIETDTRTPLTTNSGPGSSLGVK